MPTRLRRTASALVFLLLASWAWSPALDAGFARGEFQTLVEVGRAVSATGAGAAAQALFTAHGTAGHPLPALDLALSHLLWSRGGDWSASPVWPLRLENALLLCLGAWLLGRFAARALAPWTGAEHARAAGWAAAALLALHPLQPASVASLDARGALLALALCSASGWMFLRGRRDQEPRALGIALCFAVLAGFSADIALALGPVLAVAEYASGKRHRPQHARLRTAGTTLLVFGGATCVDTLCRSAVLGRWSPPETVANYSGGRLTHTIGVALERLGTLLLPIDQHVLGAAGFAVAGLLMLVALQPVLLAARSAPRLWGWLLCAWLAAFVLAEACAPWERVNSDDFTHAGTLCAASAALCVGLGLSVTALSGSRRVVLPLVVGLGYALLAHANASAFRDASDESRRFQLDLIAARQAAPDAEVIAIDPPGAVEGVEATEGAMPWMLDRAFVGARADKGAVRVRATKLAGFLALAREPEFDELRARGLVLVAPRASVAATAAPSRALHILPKPRASEGPLSWSGEATPRVLDLECASIRALHVRATEEAATDRAPIVAWRASNAASSDAESGRLRGAWTYVGDAPEALFDLSSSLEWLTTDRVKQVWSVEGWSRVREAELLDQLPSPAPKLEPRRAGDDWCFDMPGAPLTPSEVRGDWFFDVLDLETLEFVEIGAQQAENAVLTVPGAQLAVHALRGAPLAWSLERRIDGVAVDRIRGRWRR
jgi:hypothetical protein